jgi:hypothetical protein
LLNINVEEDEVTNEENAVEDKQVYPHLVSHRQRTPANCTPHLAFAPSEEIDVLILLIHNVDHSAVSCHTYLKKNNIYT